MFLEQRSWSRLTEVRQSVTPFGLAVKRLIGKLPHVFWFQQAVAKLICEPGDDYPSSIAVSGQCFVAEGPWSRIRFRAAPWVRLSASAAWPVPSAVLIATTVGLILRYAHSYLPISIIAGTTYLVALLIMHLLAPRLEPVKIF
jgi:hypothetical protein